MGCNGAKRYNGTRNSNLFVRWCKWCTKTRWPIILLGTVAGPSSLSKLPFDHAARYRSLWYRWEIVTTGLFDNKRYHYCCDAIMFSLKIKINWNTEAQQRENAHFTLNLYVSIILISFENKMDGKNKTKRPNIKMNVLVHNTIEKCNHLRVNKTVSTVN